MTSQPTFNLHFLMTVDVGHVFMCHLPHRYRSFIDRGFKVESKKSPKLRSQRFSPVFCQKFYGFRFYIQESDELGLNFASGEPGIMLHMWRFMLSSLRFCKEFWDYFHLHFTDTETETWRGEGVRICQLSFPGTICLIRKRNWLLFSLHFWS